MSEEKDDWVRSAEAARDAGDYQTMRACAREILEIEAGDIDALVIFAEATLLAGEIDEAKARLAEIRLRTPMHLRGMLVEAKVSAAEFNISDEISNLKGVVAVANQSRDPKAFEIKREAQMMLADAYNLAGEPEHAAESFFEASLLTSAPEEKASLYSKGLFTTNFRKLSPEKSLELHRGYNNFFRAKMTFPHKKNGQGSKLRIGYVSPDFRQHAAANFFTPLLKDFNKEKFMVYAYHTGESDFVTQRFAKMPAGFRDVSSLSPLEIARRIFSDHIDILVDLSGHTQNSALPVFVYRPAPVQISGIGYMNTTGLNEIDYFLSDNHCLPPDEEVRGFSEKIIRPAHSHLCYSPNTVRTPPSVAPIPAFERNGYVTFGSFNKFGKVTIEALRLWRSIVERVPGSRLVIKSKICSIPNGIEIIKEKMKIVGFSPERVEFRPYSADYLNQYRDIDIALDTFPYNGGLTTCEALVMGVPVITLKGDTHASRFGVSILENADLPELIATSELEYMNKALRIATDPEILRHFQANLRGFLQRSPLMDAVGYMRDLEEEYLKIWEEKTAK